MLGLVKVALEMLAYWTLAAVAAFGIGGLAGWLSLGGLDRRAACDVAYTVMLAAFVGFVAIGRPTTWERK